VRRGFAALTGLPATSAATAARRTATAAVLAGVEDTRDGAVDARRRTATDLVNVVRNAEDGALRHTLDTAERVRRQVDNEIQACTSDVLEYIDALTDGRIERGKNAARLAGRVIAATTMTTSVILIVALCHF
jgi:hypothetical protein